MKKDKWIARRWWVFVLILVLCAVIYFLPSVLMNDKLILIAAVIGLSAVSLVLDAVLERARVKKICKRLEEAAMSVDPAWKEKNPNRDPKEIYEWIRTIEWIGVAHRGEEYSKERDDGKFILDWTKKLAIITEEGSLALRENVAIRYLNRELQEYFGCGDGNILCLHRPVDLNAVISDALVRNSELLVGKKIGFRRVTPNVFVTSDAAMLAIILDRLIDNAVRYTPENGTIGIFCRESGDCIKMSVEDAGEGILQEEVPLVFDRGFVGSNTDKQHKGMGLYVAKMYSHMLGHRIELQSEYGNGTKVTVTMKTAKKSEE